MYGYFCLYNDRFKLERHLYPEQSLSQVLISIDNCVACLGIKKKWGNNANFVSHVTSSLWLKFVKVLKVSVMNTEIVDILQKATKTVMR
jgi:hypothetical protein